MRDWFDALASREKVFVSLGALAVAGFLVYGLVWAPLDRNQQTMATSVSDWQRSLAELRPLKGVLATSGARNRPRAAGSAQSPIIIVDQTLRGRGLEQFRQRSQPTSGSGIRVEFENVGFDELVLWLGDLSDQYDMHVQAGSVSKGSQTGPGRVNATLTLERAL